MIFFDDEYRNIVDIEKLGTWIISVLSSIISNYNDACNLVEIQPAHKQPSSSVVARTYGPRGKTEIHHQYLQAVIIIIILTVCQWNTRGSFTSAEIVTELKIILFNRKYLILVEKSYCRLIIKNSNHLKS